jgi:hypothetical protein
VNLKAKELLCEKVEALADAPADDALAVVKQLQAEWKTIGPAPKEVADDVWNRFRAACDKIWDKSRAGHAEPEPPSTGGAPAPVGYSAPKLGDLLKK